MPAGTTAAVRAKAAGKLDPARDPRARGAHPPRRDRVPDPRRGAGRRAGALAAPRHDLVRRARHVARDPAASRRADRDPRRRSTCCSRPAARRAEEHRATPLIGRSHGIHAEPITAGLVFAGWLRRARARARRRSRGAREEIAVGKIAGAVGTYAQPHARDRAARRSATLGLRRETVADPDRRARSPRRALHGARAARHRHRAACAQRPALAAHRGRRGRGGVRQGPEGLERDAAQEEPDPHREPVRPRAPAALATRRRRSRTSRCGTSATSRTRRSSA